MSTSVGENARLFREIEQKSRELEASRRHKSESLVDVVRGPGSSASASPPPGS